ncbi:MAG: Holliday junction resolvase RuvX [Ignavibacteriaceae bacterium]
MSDVELSRFMGIDYGLKRIGIAVTDPLQTFAYPLLALSNDKTLFKRLSEVIKEKNISRIILGIPSDELTSKTTIAAEVIKFKNRLFTEFKIEVIEWDETYTSIMAQQRINESVGKKKKRREKTLVDMNSASIILQEYLDSLSR